MRQIDDQAEAIHSNDLLQRLDVFVSCFEEVLRIIRVKKSLYFSKYNYYGAKQWFRDIGIDFGGIENLVAFAKDFSFGKSHQTEIAVLEAVAQSCIQRGDLQNAEQFLGITNDETRRSLLVYDIRDAFIREERFQEAFDFLDRVGAEKHKRDDVYLAMAKKQATEGSIEEAKRTASEVSYIGGITSFYIEVLRDFEGAMFLYRQARDNHRLPSHMRDEHSFFEDIIDAYLEMGRVDEADVFYREKFGVSHYLTPEEIAEDIKRLDTHLCRNLGQREEIETKIRLARAGKPWKRWDRLEMDKYRAERRVEEEPEWVNATPGIEECVRLTDSGAFKEASAKAASLPEDSIERLRANVVIIEKLNPSSLRAEVDALGAEEKKRLVSEAISGNPQLIPVLAMFLEKESIATGVEGLTSETKVKVLAVLLEDSLSPSHNFMIRAQIRRILDIIKTASK